MNPKQPSPAPPLRDERWAAAAAVMVLAATAWTAPYTAAGDEIRRLPSAGALHPPRTFVTVAPKGADPGRVLLVDDDDNAPDVRSEYTDALDALGVDYDVWDTGNSDLMEPDASTLAAYGAVIWFSGAAFTDPPPGVAGPGTAGEAALAAYLAGGGCLLISSQDYLFDHADLELTPFMIDRLGLEDFLEDLGHVSVTGAGPFAGVGPSILTSPFELFSDELTPDATAEPAFIGVVAPFKGAPIPETGVVAIAKAQGTSHATFWAFPFEALPSADRGPALSALFDWCASVPPAEATLSVTLTGTGTGTVTSSPAGIDCGTVCSETYPAGTEVTLSAVPEAGSTFTGWSGGGCSGTGTCVVTLDANTTVAAAFSGDGPGPDPTLTVATTGSGSGTVTSSPAGIDCGTDCSEPYPAGTEVTLSATPGSGSVFVGWSGGGCAGTGTCVVTLEADVAVTAAFGGAGPDTLTVTKTGSGAGRVTSSPAGIDCGGDCSGLYPRGLRVALTAVADPGSLFTGWGGGGCSGTGTCRVTLGSDTAVTAAFALDGPEPTLAVSRAGTGTGTVTSAPPGILCGLDCTQAYPAGTQVALAAAAHPGSAFSGWSGDCGGTGPCVVALDRARTVKATFAAVGAHRTLTVGRAGTGTGTVTSAPAGILCGDDCSQSYPADTVVRLTAVPAAGSSFAGWGGHCGGMTCQVTLSTFNQAVTAIFDEGGGSCPGTLCLHGDRFLVDVRWRDPEGRTGEGRAVPFRSRDSGILWFFTENNWEMLIKVLDGCGLTRHFWVFAAAGTNVEYTLTVTDTVSGQSKSYFNPQGEAAAPILDTAALAVCDSKAMTPAERPPASVAPDGSPDELAKQGSCVPGPATLCLGEDRFAVEVDWRTAAGGSGRGRVVPFSTDDSGLFWFFTENNWEMLVKVLDHCDVSGRFWVFAAALTDSGFTLKVTDTESGEVREYVNPVGRAAPAITDIEAFATCP